MASSSFFTNRDCAYFPCHEGIALDEFNCLFCYCPLYALGDRCGGDFFYLENGVKSCEHCTLAHRGDAGVRLVESKFALLCDLAQQGESR